MTKIKTTDRNVSEASHSKSIFVYNVPLEEFSSINVTGTYIVPNRWDVEARKNQVISGSQVTSNVLIYLDFVNETFNNRAAASQTDRDRFQETRLLSPVMLKQRALEALKRNKIARKELLEREASIESDL